MADKGHEETEKLLKTLEGRVNREYKQAEKDVEAKLKDYLRRFKVKDAAKRKALKRGEITQETYDKWRLGQIMIGKRWEEMRDTLAEDYLHAHEIAQGLAYDTAIDVYALNHNYGTFIAEKGALVDTSYTLYNHEAVERLIKERPNLLPDPSKDTLLKIKQGKIKRWSKQKITSAVTQGILQGEPLMDIAKRLRTVTNMDRAASIRNARTTVTNAQSAGRYDAFRRIKQMGLDPKVVWIATLDNHTRHEHRMLDGQMQEIDEPFEVEGKKILYPANTGFGDYKVPADLVYNCRCTIGVAYPGTKLYEEGLQGVDRFSRLGDMSYEEWKGIHEEPAGEGQKVTHEEPAKKEQRWQDKVKGIQERVRQAGIITEGDLHEAGGIIAGQVHDALEPKRIRFEEASKALHDFEQSSGLSDLKDLFAEVKKENTSRNPNRDAVIKRLGEIRGQIKAIEDSDEFNALFREAIRAQNEYQGDPMQSASFLRSILSEIRAMGSEGLPIADHLERSRSSMRKIIEEAYDLYPRDWVERSVSLGGMTPSKGGRGYYVHSTVMSAEIVISGYDHNSCLGVAIHELGHRYERVVPGVRDAEKEFYDRRTEGEALKWLGKGYGRTEKARFDKFIDSYMGKDYEGDAYELVSMGFQYAYTDPRRLARDPDMESWIYGILVLK